MIRSKRGLSSAKQTNVEVMFLESISTILSVCFDNLENDLKEVSYQFVHNN